MTTLVKLAGVSIIEKKDRILDNDFVTSRRDLRVLGLQGYDELHHLNIGGSDSPRLLSALLHGRLLHRSKPLEVALPLFGVQTTASLTDVQPTRLLVTLLDKDDDINGGDYHEFKKIDARETHFVIYNRHREERFPNRHEWLSNALLLAPGRKKILERVISTQCGKHHGGGVLIAGPPGFGKKTIATAIAKSSRLPIFRITGPTLYSGEIGETEEKMCRLFDAAYDLAPCCMLLESCELLLSSHKNVSLLSKRCAASLFRAMDRLTKHGVFWIASCTTDPSSKSSLPVQKRAFGPTRFSHLIYTETLSQSDRFLMLNALLGAIPQRKSDTISEYLSFRTNGYSPADLSLLASTLVSLSSSNVTTQLDAMISCCDKVLSEIRPSLLNDAIGTISRDISLSNVLGMSEALKKASQAILLPLLQPHLFAAVGSMAPSGLLLYGPSGSGKTYLGHALANHASSTLKICNALVIQSPDIISARLGSSESALANVFARARELRPCILIFDQFEVIAPKRASASSGSGTSALAGDRLLSLLLTEMDGLGSSKGESAQMPVIIIAITHDVNLLDPAVLRPGRLDVHISLSTPTSDERHELISKLFAKSPLSLDADFIQRIIKRTNGWSRADIVGLWEAAAMTAIRRSFIESSVSSISEDDLEMAFKIKE